MRNLKSRLEQLDQQIQDSRRHQVGQRELFLVINRLEEFAAAVHDRLGTIDFVTKREIIRGLVKRVEIHKDEILVVFRVDPDPGFNASETSTGSGIGEKSMQERTRRNIAIAGKYLPSLRAGFMGKAVARAVCPWRCDCRALRGRQRGGFQDAMAGSAVPGAVAGTASQVRFIAQRFEDTIDRVWSFCCEKS
jgi:site-specific DNA recombinase